MSAQSFDKKTMASESYTSTPERVLAALAAGILALIRGVVRLFELVGEFFGWLFRKSIFAGLAVVLVLVLLAGGAIDGALTNGKIYSGVRVGTVDVSGMTFDEAKAAVSEAYQPRVDTAEVVVFANEEVANSVDLENQLVQDEAIAEQISFEEAQKNKKLWMEDALSLKVSLPLDETVNSALAVGREGLGIIDRVFALLGGWTVEVQVSFSEEELEKLAEDIDATVGNVRVDFGMDIEDGVAKVTEGHDGYMVNREWLESQLSAAFLTEGGEGGTFVAQTEYVPLRIDAAAAQKTVDAVNEIIANGSRFSYDGQDLSVDRATLGEWVTSTVEQSGDAFVLNPSIDEKTATATLVSLVNKSVTGQDLAVSIDVDDNDSVSVTSSDEITVPMLTEALSTLDARLFDTFRQTGEAGAQVSDTEVVDIPTMRFAGTTSFDQALSYGIVSEIATYTTQFVSTASTQNRTHNIQLAASLLNNSVAKANGGQWTFNSVAGNCNEEAGFLPAGAISGDLYIDEAGGGICQVATTVFNAVYDAGYQVVSRSNHSLYVASYPAGRDAAVSWPDLDFVWQNDTASDVLVRTSYTDSSVTVTLYGVNPGYIVTTETGEWEEGEKHSTRTEVDESLPEGTKYTKTAGSDGMKITVVRTVKDHDGNIVRQDSFVSEYSPVTEVIVTAPNTPVDDDKDGKADTSEKDAATA